MLGKGLFKDSANRSDRYNPTKSFKLPVATREAPPTCLPIGGRHSLFGESIKEEGS
jgi:hypothetical protein